MSNGPFIILDLETTGLDPQLEGILEIAAIRLEDGQASAIFHRLVDPGVEISPASQAIHGITAAEIVGAPAVASVLPELIAFVGTDPIVAHNAPFDLGFLNRALGLARLGALENPTIDTLEIAKEVLPQLKSYKLESLCQLFGHPADGFHRALADASHLAAIFPQLWRLYGEKQAWYARQFERISHVALRYDALGKLIEDLQAEQAEQKRILHHYFQAHPDTRVGLPHGESLGLQVKEISDYDPETLLPLLEAWGLREKFLKLDRARLERWLAGDRLSPEQKAQIAESRLKLGSTQRVVKQGAQKPDNQPSRTPEGA